MKGDFEGIDELELDAEDEKYIKELLEYGINDNEHGIALIDGVAHRFTSNLPNGVEISRMNLKRCLAMRYVPAK